jgi:hypothetical protein
MRVGAHVRSPDPSRNLQHVVGRFNIEEFFFCGPNLAASLTQGFNLWLMLMAVILPICASKNSILIPHYGRRSAN